MKQAGGFNMNSVKQILIEILNLSLSASFAVAAVLVLRMLLKKAPKRYSYFLWLIVFFRFLCPITAKSALSLVPIKSKALIYSGQSMGKLTIDTGARNFDSTANYVINNAFSVAPVTSSGPNLMSIFASVSVVIWLAGIITILISLSIRFLKLKRKLQTATMVHSNSKRGGTAVYESDQISSPFLLGFFRPAIYLPLNLGEKEQIHVLAHEMMHVQRKDYLVKLICFLAVILHWFNPLIWLSFFLMIKDMEMSCDEAVIHRTREDIRAEYSTVLLNISMKQSGLILPVAFGESNTSSRIKNVLSLKRPRTWIGISAIMLIAIATITLMTSSERIERNFDDSGNGPEVLTEEELNNILIDNRTPYIGNHIKDLTLLGALSASEGLEYDHIELQTKQEPYELIVFYNLSENVDIEDIDKKTEYSNAILLFATIENMSTCSYHINNDGESYILSYSRDELEKVFGGSLYSYSENSERIGELKEKIEEYTKNNTDFGTFERVVTTEASDQESKDLTNLDACITDAILKTNKTGNASGEFKTESHIILGREEGLNSITVYTMVLYLEYGYDSGRFVDVAGSHIPTAITFSINEKGEYLLKEYWIPKEGSYYESSLREKFPSQIVEDAMDTQKYIEEQQAECDKKAEEYLK
jgi:bla regulator protein blaR1